jgi:hypothetical protein
VRGIGAALFEFGSLGWADEGEVHRPGLEQQPLARVGSVLDGPKAPCRFRCRHSQQE